MDTQTGPWLRATPDGASASGDTPPLLPGVHLLFAFAADGQEATSINTGQGSSPILGQVSAYQFLVKLAPPVTCTLIQAPSYAAGTLDIDFTLGASVPTTWNLWALVGDNSIPAWSVPIPGAPSVAVLTISFALPPVGTIGFLTTLTTAEGIICSDWQTVDTGPSTLSAEDTEKELQKLSRPSKGVPDKNKKQNP